MIVFSNIAENIIRKCGKVTRTSATSYFTTVNYTYMPKKAVNLNSETEKIWSPWEFDVHFKKDEKIHLEDTKSLEAYAQLKRKLQEWYIPEDSKLSIMLFGPPCSCYWIRFQFTK